MRVHVYNEEVTDRVQLTAKVANNVTFNGVQFFVDKPYQHTAGDDDSSAVTFWFSDKYRRDLLRKAFTTAIELLDSPKVDV